MKSVIIGNLFADRHHDSLLASVDNLMRTNTRLQRGVDMAIIDHIKVESTKSKSELQKRLFKKSISGMRRDYAVDFAVKLLIEKLVNTLRFMRYAFNRPLYTKKTYERLKKIRPIPVCRVFMPLPDNPRLRIL